MCACELVSMDPSVAEAQEALHGHLWNEQDSLLQTGSFLKSGSSLSPQKVTLCLSLIST